MIIIEQSNLFKQEPEKLLTCYTCNRVKECEFAFDPYNTNGDCLYMK